MSQSNKWRYLPVTVEIEMSHLCPVLCRGCAIGDDIKLAKYKLSFDEINSVLNQANDLGIKNYSLTGGEPFIDFPLLLKVIKNSPLDLVKINTNAYIFSSPNKTKEIYQQLLNASFSQKNRNTSSWLNISIGQQTLAGIPLENAVFASRDFYKFFSDQKAGVAILVFCVDGDYSKKIIEKYISLYKQISGLDFDSRIQIKIIPCNLSECSTALKLSQMDTRKTSILKLIKHHLASDLMINCTPPEIQKKFGIIAPRILIRADGSVFSCYGFGHVHNLGNIKTEKLEDILNKINSNLALKTVLKSGLMSLLKMAEKYKPGISSQKISLSYGPCDICRYLNDIISNKHE
jgi:organic radical activating enzyme